jgi:hypothetical protein
MASFVAVNRTNIETRAICSNVSVSNNRPKEVETLRRYFLLLTTTKLAAP